MRKRKDFSGGGTSVFYCFSDHLKTAIDSAGNIKAESDYYPWGGPVRQQRFQPLQIHRQGTGYSFCVHSSLPQA
jgi:hypothetical protein